MRTLRCLRLKSERRRTVDCYGLLFLDGHAGFYQPEPEPTGEAASMELAHLERTGAPAGFWIHLDVDVLDDAIKPPSITTFPTV